MLTNELYKDREIRLWGLKGNYHNKWLQSHIPSYETYYCTIETHKTHTVSSQLVSQGAHLPVISPVLFELDQDELAKSAAIVVCHSTSIPKGLVQEKKTKIRNEGERKEKEIGRKKGEGGSGESSVFIQSKLTGLS